jgi:hypothetical protein
LNLACRDLVPFFPDQTHSRTAVWNRTGNKTVVDVTAGLRTCNRRPMIRWSLAGGGCLQVGERVLLGRRFRFKPKFEGRSDKQHSLPRLTEGPFRSVSAYPQGRTVAKCSTAFRPPFAWYLTGYGGPGKAEGVRGSRVCRHGTGTAGFRRGTRTGLPDFKSWGP